MSEKKDKTNLNLNKKFKIDALRNYRCPKLTDNVCNIILTIIANI